MFSPWVYIYTAFFFFFFLLFFSLVRHLVLVGFQNHKHTRIHTHCTYITYTVKKKKKFGNRSCAMCRRYCNTEFFFFGGGTGGGEGTG